jgi:L-ribulokinase
VVVVEDLEMPEGRAGGLRRGGSWVELADFVPAVLGGVDDPKTIVRCVCAAGHKAMYSGRDGEGLPSEGVSCRGLESEASPISAIVLYWDRALPPGYSCRQSLWPRDGRNALGLRGRHPSDRADGRLRLRITVPVGIGQSLDGTLVKIIGTSDVPTAHSRQAGVRTPFPGNCGIVNGSILPGFPRHRSGAVRRSATF